MVLLTAEFCAYGALGSMRFSCLGPVCSSPIPLISHTLFSTIFQVLFRSNMQVTLNTRILPTVKCFCSIQTRSDHGYQDKNHIISEIESPVFMVFTY